MSDDIHFIGEQDSKEQSGLKNIKRKRKDQPDNKRKLVSALTGSVMMAGAVMPFLPAQTVQAATETGTMTVDKHYAAANETVEITIVDAGNNYNKNTTAIDTTVVAVSSPADTSVGRNPLMLVLTETGENSGIFKGSLRLVDPSTASPGADEIRVANGGTVTILDPNWNTENQLNPIVLNVERRDHVTGTIQTFDAGTLAPISSLVNDGQRVRVEVRDDDLNTDPTTRQTKTINVTTIAGAQQYSLTLEESSANSNLFTGEFTVGTDVMPANNSPLYIEYQDDNQSDNSPGLITKKLVRKDLTAATLSALPTKAAYDEPITVTLTDNDLNIDPSIKETATVKITSAEDSAGINLTLTETGPDTGVFTGTFTMQNASNSALNQIKVLNGNSVTVNYTDLRDAIGSTSSLSSTIARKDHVSGTIAVDKTNAVVGETVTITVNDADYINTVSGQIINVQVKSATDSTGISVPLTETADTGVFKGTFTITNGASVAGSQISAANGEAISVTYLDAITANNSIDQPVVTTLNRKDRMTGVLSYNRLSSPTGEIIEVSLNDTDLDIDPNAVDTASVTVTSIDDPTGFYVTLTETGVGTGVFKGQFKPVLTATNDTLSPQELLVAYNNNLIVTYTDEHRANNTKGNVVSTFKHLQVPAVTAIQAFDTGGQVGAGGNDTVKITFDMMTNQSVIAPSDIAAYFSLDAGSWGTPANGLSATWSDAQNLVITVGSDATVKKGAIVSLNASAGIKDALGNSAASVGAMSIGGTFGSQVPAITSITAADAGNQVGAGSGDTVTIVFDTPTSKPTVALTDLVLSAGSFGTEGNGASLLWTNATTLVVTLGSDATVKKGATLSIASSANIQDIGLESAVSTASGAIGGSFGSQVPAITSITAADAGGQVGAGSGDTVTIVFDTATSEPTVALADLVLSAGSFGTAGNGASAAWTNATTLVVTLGSDATVKKGATFTIAASANIQDIGLESAASTASSSIGGTFGSRVPDIASITAVNAGNQVGAGSGDAVTIVFDTPTNEATVGLPDLVLSAGSFGTAGNGASVVWLNATTLVVTLGSDATVKKGATLTIAVSAGIKDIALESAVSTASSTIGGTFGSQVPGITSITAADAGSQVGAGLGDTVTIVFDTPTNEPTVGLSDLVLSAGSFGTAGNGATVAWTDATTLVVTLGSDATVKSGATLSIAATANIQDIGMESAVSTASSSIGGSFGSQVPDIVSITAADAGNQVGSGSGDTVTIVFDTPTNEPTVALTDLFLSAGSFGTAVNGASTAWTNATTLVVTLGSDATVKKGATLTIAATANIQDIGAESAASTASSAIGGTFGSQVPVIASITAVDAGNQVGAGSGDTVTIVFDTATSAPTIALTDLVLSTGSFGTAGNGASASWTNATTLVVTLGSDATVKKGATLTIAASANIQDIGLESAASTASSVIGGTFGSQVPDIVSITAADAGNQVGAGSGDTVTIKFDTPTSEPTVALTDLVLSAGSFGTAGNGASAAWTNTTTLVVTLGSDATVKKGATLTIAATANIQDIGLESAASTANGPIGGSFGSQVPSITSITAADAGGQVGAGSGDTVTIVFDTPTNRPTVGLSDLVLSAGSFGTTGNGASVAWTNATTLVVTLGSDATVKKGATLTIAASANIQDIGLESAASTASSSIGGSFGSQVPNITSIDATDDGNQVGAGLGDKITIVFDTPTSRPAVALTDLVLSAGSLGTAGNGASAAWTNATTLVVTLGSDATVKMGATLSIASTANIQDIGAESAASMASGVIGGSFGSQVPGITSITAADDGNQVGAGQGDTITIVFDTPTSEPTVALTDLVLSAGSFGTAGNGASTSWTNATTLVVTLGSDATVKKGATLTIAASANIQDIGLESAASTASSAIGGSFGSKVPEIASITAVDAGNQVGAGSGDTVTIVFDTATSEPTIALTDLVLSAGSFGTAGNGASLSWTNATTLVVTLGSDATVRKGATLSIASSANIQDIGMESTASTASGAIGGTFGVGSVPDIASITATDAGGQVGAGSGDTVTIVFDTQTSRPVVALTDLVLGAGSFGTAGNGASVAWTNATTLVVTLGSDATVKKGATLTIATSANIQDIGAESAASTASSAIAGTFGSQVPDIASITAADAGGQVGAGSGDIVTIVFDTATNEPTVALADLVLSAGSFGTAGNGASVAWTNATTLVVTLGSDATVKKGAMLSIASSANIQDIGLESAVSTASSTIGGTFGSQVPDITSITAVDSGGQVGAGSGDTVTIVFDTATNEPTVALTDLVLSAGSFGTAGNGASVAWTNATTLVVTLGSDATVKKGATLTFAVTAGIKDIGLESAVSTASSTIGGTFGSRVPDITSITAVDAGNQVGAGSGDTVTIVFDTPTNRITVALTGLVLSAGSFGTAGNGASTAWTDATTLVVTLGSDATVKKGATLSIASSANIQDIGAESAASTASGAIGGTFGSQVPDIVSTTAADAGNQVGSGSGDTVTIVFDTATSRPTVALTDLVLSAGSFGTAGNGASAAWTNATTLVVTLGSDATVKMGATLTIAPTANVQDIGAESAASTASGAIGGTFGSQVPDIASITAADAGNQVGAGLGDTVTIVFDTPTSRPTVGLSDLTLSAGSFGTAGNGAAVAWTNATTLVITLGSDATVKKGATLTIAASANIQDIGLESAASTASSSIGGTFGSQVPDITSITAADAGGQVGAGLGDTVTIVFDTPTNEPTVGLSDLVLSAGSFGTTGNGASAAWTNATTLLVTLGSDATVKKGATLTIAVSAGIKDIALESAVSTASSAIGGTFGSRVPGITSITAADAGSQPGPNSGDTVTVVFDTPTSQPVISLSDLTLSAGTFGTLANGASSNWVDNTTLIIRLGSDATVRKGALLSIAPTANIQDIGLESVASTASLTIGGTFGIGTIPNISAIQATNDMGGPGPENGDKVTISFTAVTNTPAIDLADIVLDNGHSWGAGAHASWNSNGSALTITLGAGATVAVGDNVTILAGAGITEISGELSAITGSAAITGTFGDLIVPVISSILATNGGGTAAVEQNDTLEISFNVPTNAGTVDLSKLVVSNGHHLGTSPTTAWSADGSILTIKLGVNPTIVATDTIDVLAGIGIKDASGTSDIAPQSNIAITGSFGTAVAPQATNVYATNGDGLPNAGAGDTLVIVFDTPTNGGAIDLSKFVLSNGRTFGANPSAAWSSGNTRLVITLGAGADITTTDTLTINSGSGILDTTGQASLAGTADLSIGGSFGVAVAPVVSSITATNGDGKPTVGAGDKLIVVLDSPSNGVGVDLTKFSFSNGHTLGTGATASWSSDKLRLTITLGVGANIATTDTVSIASGSEIADTTGTIELTPRLNIAIGGSFGVAVAPVISAINAINGDGKPTVGAGDKLLVIFDTPTNGGSVDLTKIAVSGGHTLGTGPSYAWSANNTHLTIKLGTNPTITTNDTIDILALFGVSDATNQAALATQSNIAIGGSFGVAIAPNVTDVYALNTGGTPAVDANDQIVIVFDTDVDYSGFNKSAITIDGHAFGTNANFDTSDSKKLVITLKDTVGVTQSSTISIDGALSGIKDITKQAAVNNVSSHAIGGSFGVAIAPNVTAINAIDGDGTARVAAGDKLRIAFDSPVKLVGFTLDNVLADGQTGAFGSTATFNLDASGTILTITFGGTGIAVTNSSVISMNGGIFDAATGSKALANGGSLPSIRDNFGTAVAPKVITAVAIDQNGLYSIYGDRIDITFDSPTNGSVISNAYQTHDLIQVSNGHTIGDFAAFSWSNNNRTLTVSLATYSQYSSVTGAVYANLQVGDILDLSGLGIKDATGTADAEAGSVVLGGSFVPGLLPEFTYAVASTNNRNNSARILGTIDLIFNTAMYHDPSQLDLSKISVTNSHNFGTGATIAWSSANVLSITVMLDATVEVGDMIDLSKLQLKDSGGIAYVPANYAVKSLTGSFGSALTPSVISVMASNTGMNPGAGVGDTITITFASDTNGIAGASVDVSSLAGLIGNDASAKWLDARTLVITVGNLGANPTLADNGLITIDSLNIKDVTGKSSSAKGSYEIGGTFGQVNSPSVVSIVASSDDKNKATSAIASGDMITITFDMPTNQSGTWDRDKINQFIQFGTSGSPKILGAGYQGTWRDNGRVLVITVTDVTGSTIQIGDSIHVQGIKNAMGNSPANNDSKALAGMFDGREFAITSFSLTSGGAGTLIANLLIEPLKGHDGSEVVILEISKGSTPVQLIASVKDITGNVEIKQIFSNLEGDLSAYTVRAYIFDNYNSTTGSQLLSQKIEMKLN
ncbi:beta strand repeat-containing protein [Paenibacillus planticolens]|uniref:S-layer family protein n=1 Tax=Paenibacillus planticolens TaxID=2654976 RepID=A0ABX1ZMF3_9BACL|nr:hypothetical protein [Paenibacillus planticolens]NOU99804.1 hypothetical protein [Paenibacillus planticolens]